MENGHDKVENKQPSEAPSDVPASLSKMESKADRPKPPFLSAGSVMRKAMRSRCVEKDMPHLMSILDAMKDGEIVLEIGCGPGGITLSIAQQYPNLKVLGIDIDEESIKDAKYEARWRVLDNLSYAVGDAVDLVRSIKDPNALKIVKEGCHLVYSHATIMHTSNQVQAIKDMQAACKPWSTISLKEGDMGLFFVYPEVPGMMKLLEMFPRLGCCGEGADPLCGRRLASHAVAAGLTRGDVHDFNISMSSQISSSRIERERFVSGFDKIFEKNSEDAELMRSAGLDLDTVSFIREDTLPTIGSREIRRSFLHKRHVSRGASVSCFRRIANTLLLVGMEEWATCEDGILSFSSVVLTKKNVMTMPIV